VVNIIEDWDVLEEYAGEKLGFYQLLGSDGMFEVRVQTGRVGFKREFEKGDDPLLNKILELTTALDFSSDSAKEPDGQQAELGEVSAAAAVTERKPTKKSASADAGADTTGKVSKITVKKRN
jgi:hypothetical protein